MGHSISTAAIFRDRPTALWREDLFVNALYTPRENCLTQAPAGKEGNSLLFGSPSRLGGIAGEAELTKKNPDDGAENGLHQPKQSRDFYDLHISENRSE